MTFLNPGILLGLLASSIPVIIHLINLRKLKKVEFSTLRFLKEIQKTKIRRVKLKQWILLLLRVLIITFLVLSFARPTLESELWGGASKSKTTAVFLLDNSASMKVIGDEGSIFNNARQIVKTLSEGFSEGDELTLITFSDDSSSIRENRRAQEIVKELGNKATVSLVKSINNPLENAAAIFNGSDNFNKELYIISDFQKNLFSGDTLNQQIPQNVKTILLPLSLGEIINYAITDFKINNQILERNKPVSFTVTVKNYSDEKISDVALSLIINEQRTAVKSITLEAGVTENYTLETTLKDIGLLDISAELEEDSFNDDNAKYLSVFVPEKIRIAVFSKTPQDVVFLQAALTNAVSENSVTADFRSINRINTVNLNNYDLLFIIGEPGESSFGKVEDYLSKQGKLVFAPSVSSTAEDVNKFLKVAGIRNLFSQEVKLNDNTLLKLNRIDYDHPLFYDLFMGNRKPEVDSPEYYRYFRMNNINGVKDIFRLEDNSPALAEMINSNVIIFNTPFTLQYTDLPLKGVFAPLLARIIYYSVIKTEGGNSYFSGDEVAVNIAGNTSQPLSIVRSGGYEEFVSPDKFTGKSTYSFRNTEQPGFYSVYYSSELTDYFTINTINSESDLTSYNNENIEKALETLNILNPVFLDYTEDYSEELQRARAGTELWRHLLIIALLLAIAEMLISRNTKKDLADLN